MDFVRFLTDWVHQNVGIRYENSFLMRVFVNSVSIVIVLVQNSKQFRILVVLIGLQLAGINRTIRVQIRIRRNCVDQSVVTVVPRLIVDPIGIG